MKRWSSDQAIINEEGRERGERRKREEKRNREEGSFWSSFATAVTGLHPIVSFPLFLTLSPSLSYSTLATTTLPKDNVKYPVEFICSRISKSQFGDFTDW